MFGIFKKALGTAPTDASNGNDREAAAALLVAIAQSDHEYAEVEQTRIDVALAELYAIEPEAAQALRSAGEKAFADSSGLHRFTQTLKEAYDMDERGAFMEAAWRVVFADEVREAHENALMRQLVLLLGVDDHLSAEARRRAQSRAE